MHRSRPRTLEQAPGALQKLRQLCGIGHGVAEQRDLAAEAVLIRHLVQLTTLHRQTGSRQGARHHQHRDRRRARLQHGGRNVGQTRPRYDKADARFAAGASVAIGHETGALLMPRCDVPNRAVAQTPVELGCVYAGDTKDRIDLPRLERCDQVFTKVHALSITRERCRACARTRKRVSSATATRR